MSASFIHHHHKEGTTMKFIRLLACIALGLGFTLGAVSVASASDGNGGKVCVGEHIPGGDFDSVTITAPEGQLISGYCVKAGSAEQGLGPEYVTLDPPVAQVTITHSSGKDISHYVVTYVPVTPPTETTTPTPSGTPSETSTPTPTETETSTPTPTVTETSTPTPTETETSTPTPTETETSTPTPSETETSTPTPSETETSTPTPSDTPSESASPSDSPSPSDTPSQDVTPQQPTSLAQTGSDTGNLLVWAVGLILAGGFALLATRKTVRQH